MNYSNLIPTHSHSPVLSTDDGDRAKERKTTSGQLEEVNLDAQMEVNLDAQSEVNLDAPSEVNLDAPSEVNLEAQSEHVNPEPSFEDAIVIDNNRHSSEPHRESDESADSNSDSSDGMNSHSSDRKDSETSSDDEESFDDDDSVITFTDTAPPTRTPVSPEGITNPMARVQRFHSGSSDLYEGLTLNETMYIRPRRIRRICCGSGDHYSTVSCDSSDSESDDVSAIGPSSPTSSSSDITTSSDDYDDDDLTDVTDASESDDTGRSRAPVFSCFEYEDIYTVENVNVNSLRRTRSLPSLVRCVRDFHHYCII